MKTTHWITRSMTPVTLGLILVACGGGGDQPTPTDDTTKGAQGPAGASTLARTATVEPGEECEKGGVRIETGLDADGNGELSFEEVTAGSTTVICSNDVVDAPCGEPLEILDVRGVDQRFVLGQQAELAVDLNVTDNVTLQVVGHGFDAAPGAEEGSVSVIPRMIGGPLDLAVVASDGCSVDVATVRIDEVESNRAELRVAWFYSTWRNATIAESGSTDPLFAVDVQQVTPPVVLEPATYTFDLIGQFGDVLTTLEPYEALPQTSSTLVTYPTATDELAQIYLEDDVTPVTDGVRLRALNVSADVGTVDIEIPGASAPMFGGLNLGLPAAARSVPEQPLALTLSRGGETWDYAFDGLFEPGTKANLFVYDDDGAPNALVQFLDDDGASVTGVPVNLPNESFEDPSVTSGNLPPGFCEPLFPTWTPTSNGGSDGSRSMTGEVYYTNSATVWFEMTFLIPLRGSVSFDTRTVGQAVDTLGYCYSVGVDGCPPGNGNLTTCDFTTAEETWAPPFDWTTRTTPVLDPGTYTIRWIYKSGGVYRAPTYGYGYAFVDHIRFVPE